jgi:hypothetical protein
MLVVQSPKEDLFIESADLSLTETPATFDEGAGLLRVSRTTY